MFDSLPFGIFFNYNLYFISNSFVLTSILALVIFVQYAILIRIFINNFITTNMNIHILFSHITIEIK